MGQVRFHKVVSALPSPLEKDGLYLVRTGEGFDLYASDSTGSIAHKVNTGATAQDTGWRDLTGVLGGLGTFDLKSKGCRVLFRRTGDRAFVMLDFHTRASVVVIPQSSGNQGAITSGALPDSLLPLSDCFLYREPVPGNSSDRKALNGAMLTRDGRLKLWTDPASIGQRPRLGIWEYPLKHPDSPVVMGLGEPA